MLIMGSILPRSSISSGISGGSSSDSSNNHSNTMDMLQLRLQHRPGPHLHRSSLLWLPHSMLPQRQHLLVLYLI